MRHTMLAGALAITATITAANAEMLRRESARPVAEVAERLEKIVKEKGFTVFARVDHAAGAQSVGQTLRPTQLLIFGNPAGGTPLMQAQQTMGMALPLRVLVWQDADGKTWIGHDAMPALAAERGLKDHPALGRIGEALKGMTDAAAAP